MSVAVEDVNAYLRFIKERAGITEPVAVAELVKELTGSVPPLLIGRVERGIHQTKGLAEKLLRLHMDLGDVKQLEQAARITDILTWQLQAHEHMICWREAKEDVGLPVIEPDRGTEDAMCLLYGAFERDLEFRTPFDLPLYVGDAADKGYRHIWTVIQTTDASLANVETGMVERRIVNQGQPNEMEKYRRRRASWSWIDEYAA
jgi:hypothetical protein